MDNPCPPPNPGENPHHNSDTQNFVSWFFMTPPPSQNNIWGTDTFFFTEDKKTNYWEEYRVFRLKQLQGSYIGMMTHEKESSLFQKLLAESMDHHLNIIVDDIIAAPLRFIHAAFCNEGAISIIKFIERLENSNHAFTVTEILSRRFWELMTDDIARFVIQHCFTCFGNQHNMILYEMVINHYQALAIHRVGCRSLNGVIDTIFGQQRERLLYLITDSSVCLSNDQFGNYVIQHVQGVGDENVSGRIVSKLKGHFVELSKLSGGSRIVEKCMEVSRDSLILVVNEILSTHEAPLVLAQDRCGNYVIQNALIKTKEHGLRVWHDSLVNRLRPYRHTFNQTPGLWNLVRLLDGGRVM